MQFWQVLIGLIMATQAERELYPNFVALAGVSCCGWLSWRRTVFLLRAIPLTFKVAHLSKAYTWAVLGQS
ncbi:hypothetical protein AB3S75_011957 [Citrus x aurantiifolia]